MVCLVVVVVVVIVVVYDSVDRDRSAGRPTVQSSRTHRQLARLLF